MITYDYHTCGINSEETEDLRAIADIEISKIKLEEYPNLLIFPDSFDVYDRDFGKDFICRITNDSQSLVTNSIVGFVGRNNTHLAIHSRFAPKGSEDYFLHYMLQKVAKINLLSLQYTLNEDGVFDFMIYLFPPYLKRAINKGVYKQYITKKCNDSRVKGVVDVCNHIKNNIPFNGNISYSTREYSYDNDITQLIRHTIDFISSYKCPEVLNIDTDTRQAVLQIISATPSFSSKERQAVINKNLRPLVHPFYSEYAALQRLCLQILRYEELKYGQEKDEIYGVLVDAAWLWEEYLSIILKGKFNHYLKDEGERFYLFKPNVQQIIPDFLSLNKDIVADAKYIPLKDKNWFSQEKATAIYYKTIAYMYRFCSKCGYLFYPHPDEPVTAEQLEILSSHEGTNGGKITKLGLRIPCNCRNYEEFCSQINLAESAFINELKL